MAPEAVSLETVFQLPSEPAQREVPQGKNTSTSRKSSWKPSVLQNIKHVSIHHYHNVKRSLANLRGADDADSKEGRSLKGLAKQYARKWTGANEGLFPPRPTFRVLFWSWVAAFVGIAVLALLTYNAPWYAPTDAILHERIHTHLVFLIGSFGASAVLVFGSIDSPLAQPRNLLGGHVLSASVGIAIAEAFSAGGLAYPKDDNKLVWVQAGMAVATAIVLMQFTRTVHPPGGATALIAVTSPPALRLKGFFIVIPVLSGSLILLLVALIVNNIRRHYPLYWWSPDVIDVPMEDLTHHTGSGEAFMPHSESLVGVSLQGSRRGGPSLHGSVRGDSTHHSRVSYIDLSTDAGGGSTHGRRPRGEMYAPVRHHIIQFPMHVLQAEGALGGGLEPDVVMDRPTVGELKASGKGASGERASGDKLVLPDGDRNAIPPMERVEGWVENDARGPFERRGSGVRQEWMEQEGGVGGGQAGRPSETRDSGVDEVLATTPAENEGQVHGANSILATAIGNRPSAETEAER